MQWPPTPGPGVKRMNPNGLVAAASMTSQTSRPIRSHSSASWLTNAMLTLRNVFSSSLAISAASGDDSSIDAVVDVARAVPRRASVAAGVVPPTRRGTPAGARGVAGVHALGREGEVEVLAGPQARSSRTSRNGPVVVPGKVVDWRTTSWPARSGRG